MTKNIFAYPIATGEAAQTVQELAHLAFLAKVVKSGLSERKFRQLPVIVNHALSKRNAFMILIAADVEPFAIVSEIPQLCEEAEIFYCFLGSKRILGRCVGLSQPTSCILIEPNDNIVLHSLKNKILVQMQKIMI